MLTAKHWTELSVLDRGIGEGTEGVKDVYSPMGGVTVSTGQIPWDWTTNHIINMKEILCPAACVAEDGLVGCQQEEWLLDHGECQGRKMRVGGWVGKHPHRASEMGNCLLDSSRET